MKRIIKFSGGKTSAYMTIKYYQPGDIVLFADTGREHPKTYKFIHDFEANENIPVTKIGYVNGFDGWLESINHKMLPNRVKRACTVHLKINVAKKWFRSNFGKQDYIDMIGFRADEERRVKKYDPKVKYIHPYFPLYENGITKQDIELFWSKKSYNLEIPSILGNCTLCFLKGKNTIINILSSYPELADEWIRDEELAMKNGGGTGRQYFQDVTYKDLLKIAQSNLFKGQNLTNLTPAYNCSCTT